MYVSVLSTVNCPSQETEVTSTPTRPVDNVVITTKGLQDRNIHIIDGTRVENKGKLILRRTCTNNIFHTLHLFFYVNIMISFKKCSLINSCCGTPDDALEKS